MIFSHRTSWDRRSNRLSEALETRRCEGKPILDLAVSNPTECGFIFPTKEITQALANPETVHYQPDPRGLLNTRQAVAEYYHRKNVSVSPSNIFLTASTSEAYSLIFKLLCNPNDEVLVPRPSYPLFDYLAQVNDVRLRHYSLRYDGSWHIDLASVRAGITPTTRAIVLVNPHNPTGMFLMRTDYGVIQEIAQSYGLALIIDEVFIDYPFQENSNRVRSTAEPSDVLTFTLNGISKSLGLPQMKLGWIVVGGSGAHVAEASGRLEILCDTFLSVGTPVQLALPSFHEAGKKIQLQILGRVKQNYATLINSTSNLPCSIFNAEGGWYGIVRMPGMKSDEEWALTLLEETGVYVQPGYFFDFEEKSCVVVSLIVAEETFQEGMKKIVGLFSK